MIPMLGAGAESLPWQDHELEHVNEADTVEISSRRHEWQITMDGTVDMDHAMTRDCVTWHIGWQPNESLTIENIGPVPCENPKVIINDRGDWYTMDGILREATRGAETDQDKVYLIWQFARSNRHHDSPVFIDDELHDPVRMFMIYGAGLCDDSGSFGGSLYYEAGFKDPAPILRALHGHMMCEVFAEGRWQFMDIDENAFYLDRENELPVGGDVLSRDHDLGYREVPFGPIFHSRSTAYEAVPMFGRDDGKHTRLTRGHQIRVHLRPGERIEYRWDNIGKWARCKPSYRRSYVGNSRKIYQPSLSAENAGAEEAENVTAIESDGQPAVAANGEGRLLYRMNSAFTFCGGNVKAAFQLHRQNDRAVIEAGSDLKALTKVWEAAGPGAVLADVEIDDPIDPVNGGPKREFYVRIRLISASGPSAAALKKLVLRGDIMVSPIALPRLRLGQNKVVYTDESSPERRVRVTYRWRETTATRPVRPPAHLYPPDGQTIHDAALTYRWEPVDGAVRYHLQVCRDPKMRWPYRPSLDFVFEPGVTEYGIPFTGIYAPDTTYYWRLRSQNDKGIWGDWSRAHTFRWSGPRVPVDVRLQRQDDKFVLKWAPNPRGARPVAYEIYGSDIKGFSVNKAPYKIQLVGFAHPWSSAGLTIDKTRELSFAGNYLGRTDGTEMAVAGAAVARMSPPGAVKPENLNRCFYRVVAIDQRGTPSGCSAYAEMPHPFIWTNPATAAQVGQAYRYQAKAIRSMGDLQHRYGEWATQKGFWEKENLCFSLVSGPAWLAVDSRSGLGLS